MFHVTRTNKAGGSTHRTKSLDDIDNMNGDCEVVQERRIRWRFYKAKTVVGDNKNKTGTKYDNATLESTMHTLRTRQSSLVHYDDDDDDSDNCDQLQKQDAKSIHDVNVLRNDGSRSQKSRLGKKIGRVGRGLFMSKNKKSDSTQSKKKKNCSTPSNNNDDNKNNFKTIDITLDGGEYDAYFPKDGGLFDDSDNRSIDDGEEQERGAGVGVCMLRAFPSIPISSPKEYCKTLLSSLGYVDYRYRVLESGYQSTPTRIQLASYDNYIIQLVDNSQIHELRDCLLSGLSCNPVNVKNGDTLCHYICYTGNVAMLDTILQCAKETLGRTSSYSPIQTCNYKGRTPLHDACSAPTLNLGVIEILLKCDPNLLFMADSNDTLPIEYIRHEHWSSWINFLQNKLPIFFPKRCHPSPTNEGDISKVRPQPIPPLVSIQPNTRVCPDPPIYLSIKMIELIANGTMRPSVIQFNNPNHSHDDDDNDNDDNDNDDNDNDDNGNDDNDSDENDSDENDNDDEDNVSHRESMAVSVLTEPMLDHHSSFYNDDDDIDDESEETEETDVEMNEDDVAAFVQAFYGNSSCNGLNIDDDDDNDCGDDNESVDSRLALIRDIVNAPNRQSIFMLHQQMSINQKNSK